MKKVFLIIAFLSLGTTFAQNAKVESKIVSEFQKAYNTSNYEAIYEMYSSEKQNKHSLEDIKAYFERIHNSSGDITSVTLDRKQKEYTVYKAVFTKTKGEVVVKLNNKGKADILTTRSAVAVKN